MHPVWQCSVLDLSPDDSVELPVRHSSELVRIEIFQRAAKLILKEYRTRIRQARKQSAPRKPITWIVDKPDEWLARTLYVLLAHFIDKGFANTFAESPGSQRPKRSLHPSGLNSFNLGVTSVMGKDLSPQKKTRLIRQLLYAYCHYVPPNFLAAFTTHAGGLDRVAMNVSDAQMCEFYRPWVERIIEEREGGRYILDAQIYFSRKLSGYDAFKQSLRGDYDPSRDFDAQ